MGRQKVPATPAIRQLKQHKVRFIPHFYAYSERGGTAAGARELNIPEHRIIKTLLMEDEQRNPLIILMHGDCEVSQKHLARQLQVKRISPCTAQRAEQLTGYQPGGISPFGTQQELPIYLEESIARLPSLLINGGRRGLLVEMTPADLMRILRPVEVSAAI